MTIGIDRFEVIDLFEEEAIKVRSHCSSLVACFGC